MVKDLREHMKITQHELANLSGVSRPVIARIETGLDLKKCKADTVAKLAKALGVTVEQLLNIDVSTPHIE